MVLAANGSTIMDGVLFASAVVPPLVVIVLAWVFLRAGRRADAVAALAAAAEAYRGLGAASRAERLRERAGAITLH